MAKNSWKWSGLKEDLENFPGDNLIMLPPQGVSDPSFFRVSKDRILQLIDDAAKVDEFAKVQKPKTVVEEIWYEMSRHANGLRPSNVALRMALAEVVEWMDEGYGYLLDGAKAFQASKTEIEVMRSIVAILKGEKARGIPKA